ncbi:replication initiator protein A (plasmid) [Staphylococcus warneri]|uniref:Replication protein n=2 Tax=Staphylococcus warneri TaxID=1292 RepID=Q75V09_STAWA|nr:MULTISPECIES: replication initiator protein A [Staphylococcus]MCG1162684.1 replication initiator protein A [Staphylococcus epidermidis]MCR4456045.1 replication initiator protein A [Aeromonas salmonicida]MCH4421109.1 replication initiator protein A [Staphylococcus haemolyticus]WNF19516.1 replication initiator protein A [Staphylococcus warneri]BAD01016.1 replication protein [Staphylococcus warneri]
MTKQRFTKLYKFLFEDSTFNKLSIKAKLLYALLTERQNLSKLSAKQHGIQSQFIDDNGRLFSIYTNKELMNIINISEPTVINLKKQLIAFGLLEEIRLGKNKPNRLYPKKPYDEYFYVHDVDEFYRLPHSLFSNPKYKNLKAETIVAYAVYLSRYEYSVYKNHFSDKSGEIYCHFSNEKMAEFLGVSTRKVERIKKELVVSGLMINKRATFGKANNLYINLPKPFHIKELKNCRVRNLKIVGTGTKKLSGSELKNCRTSNIDISNTDVSDTDISDTNDLNDTYEINKNTNYHSNHTNHQQTEFNNDALKFQVLEELPTQIKIYLSNFEIKDIRFIKSVLLKGKKSFNNVHDTYYRLEDVEFELVSVLKRFKAMLLQKNETVETMQGYLMQSIKAELEEIHVLNMRRQNIPHYNIFNQ